MTFSSGTLAEVFGDISPLAPIHIPLADSIGSRTAEPVRARRPYPSLPVAQTRGYAVRLSDVAAASRQAPVALRLADSVPAGYRASEPLAPGTTIRLAAGAPIPEGADGFVTDAGVQESSDHALFLSPAMPADWQPRGSVIEPDQVLLRAGERVTHAALIPLTLAGIARVPVHPRPRIVVVTVGSQWVRITRDVTDGLTHDPSGVVLPAVARSLGADGFRVGPIPDDEREIRQSLEDQLVRADLLVTVGGIDGPADPLRSELQATGTVSFDWPPIEPLGSYGLGRIGPEGTPVVALPDDPAAAWLGFHHLVRPLIDAFRGVSAEEERRRLWGPSPARLSAPVVHRAPGTRLVPGRLHGESFEPVPDSPPRVQDIAGAEAMIAVTEPLPAGATVEVLRWPG